MGRFDALTQLDNKPVEQMKKKALPSSLSSPVQSTDLPANPQTSKDVNLQTSKPANIQTGLHANPQTGKPVFIEKYSTYLTPDCKRGLKRLAFETDRKDYEVLIEAVEQYLEKQNPQK